MIYLASPYSSGSHDIMEHRYELAMRACAGLFHQGIVVYSPIVHWHEVAKRHNLPRDYKPWEDQDRAMIKICTEAWALDIEGREESVGMLNDLTFARICEKKVRIVSMEECLRGVNGSKNEPKEDKESKD